MFAGQRLLALLLGLVVLGGLRAAWQEARVGQNTGEQQQFAAAPAEKGHQQTPPQPAGRQGLHTRPTAPPPAAPFACIAAIDERNADIGMASHLLETLGALEFCENLPGAVPAVFWSGCLMCAKDGSDAWAGWFEPVNSAALARLPGGVRGGAAVARGGRQPLCPAPAFQRARGGQRLLGKGFGVHPQSDYTPCAVTPERRQHASRQLKQYVRLAPALRRQVEAFERAHFAGRAVITVHVRATDHVFEFAEDNMVFLTAYYTQVDALVAQLRSDGKRVRIFIASDNDEAVAAFVQRYGAETVVATDAPRVKKFAERSWIVGKSAKQRHDIGAGIFMDAWLLSKGLHMVHWDSAVCALAAYLSPQMQSHYLPSPDEVDAKGKHHTAASIRACTRARSAKERRALAEAARLRRCQSHADCQPVSPVDGKAARTFCGKVYTSADQPAELRCVKCSIETYSRGGEVPAPCTGDKPEEFGAADVDAEIGHALAETPYVSRLFKLSHPRVKKALAGIRKILRRPVVDFVPGVSGGVVDDLVADILSQGGFPAHSFRTRRYTPGHCPGPQTICKAVPCSSHDPGRTGPVSNFGRLACNTVCGLPELVNFAALAETHEAHSVVGDDNDRATFAKLAKEGDAAALEKLARQRCECNGTASKYHSFPLFHKEHGISVDDEAQHEVQRGLLLDVVVRQRAAVLQLLARKDQALRERRGS